MCASLMTAAASATHSSTQVRQGADNRADADDLAVAVPEAKVTSRRTARSPQSISYRTPATPGTDSHADTMAARSALGTLVARTT